MDTTKKTIARSFFQTGLLLAVFLSPAAWPGPFVVDDVSRITDIEKITILPVVTVADIPRDKEAKLMDQVRKQLALELALKGYALKREKVFSRDRDLTATDITAMTPAALATLGPDKATHILILFFNALEESFIGIADSTDTRLAAVLIDKATAEVLWKNEVDEGFTSSWYRHAFIGMLIIDEDEAAIWHAFKKLFEEFPGRPM